VEAKAAQTGIDAGLRKIQQQLGVPAVQLVGEGTTFRKISNGAHTILVAPAALWLPRLP
jgi:hypothetical protein